jgi:hypothetical protein
MAFTFTPGWLRGPFEAAAPSRIDRAGLEISEVRVDETGKPPVVRGIVHNRSHRTYRDVEVSFDLLNESDSAMGTAAGGNPVMRAGAQWEFRLLVSGGRPASVRLRELTGTPE